MNKFLSILSLCMVIFTVANAGDDDKKGLPNGIRFGYQQSNLVNSSSSATTLDPVNYGYIGYLRKIHLVPLIHLETGMEFMINGAQQNSDNKSLLYYLVLPVQGVIKIGPFVGLAGINGNFRVAEKVTVDGSTVTRSGSDKSNFFDFAVDAGAGFNIAIVTIEARYYWGLADVQNNYYNRYWQAGLKIHF